MKSKHYLTLWRSLFLLGLSALLSGGALAQTSPFLAPLNPRFVAYQQQRLTRVTHTASGHPLGYVPPSIQLSVPAKKLATRANPLTLPATFDLRNQGKLTPVKNQLSSGCCWAFATYGSLESCLLPKETWDFSENNLKNTHGFDEDPNTGGGNFIMSTAYLARWSGPIKESDDPYDPNSTTSPSGLIPAKHVQQVLLLPPRTSSLDNDGIKQALMQYGAVGISLCWADTAFAPTTNSFYYSANNPQNNHAVAIVGWDDSYPASKFTASAPPPGNGAFIVRNSWGANWGENGYFYISYYDTSAATQDHCAVFVDAEPTTNYLHNYQYDPLGLNGKLGTGTNSTTAWGANIFTASANEQVAAVGLYSLEAGMTCQISVYTAPNLGPLNTSQAAVVTTAQLPYQEYVTVPLSKPVVLKAGQKFSIVVKFITKAEKFPIPCEMKTQDTSKATGKPGQGYYGADGSSWQDVTQVDPSIDLCIKAFTTSTSPPVAVDDNYTAVMNTPLFVPAPGVLSNDSDPNNQPLTAVLTTQTSHGTVLLNADGSFTYTPISGYYGKDSFTYQASNGTVNSSNATVHLTVYAPPLAVNDNYTSLVNQPLTVSAAQGVLVNDSDPNGVTFTSSLVTPPAHGTVTLNPDGSFTYTSTANYFGKDTFTYQDSNGFTISSPAKVTMTIIAPPIANNDSYVTVQNTPLSIPASGVLNNDTDFNNLALTANLVANATNGNVILHADGSFTYTPSFDYIGLDSFTYMASNNWLESNSATVNLAVNSPGYEGQLNLGWSKVVMNDWVEIGNILIGNETMPTGALFQRADCAPRATKGKGSIGVSDWVQVGRYVVGLDPLTPAGGPFAPVTSSGSAAASPATRSAAGGTHRSAVQLATAAVSRNHTVTIPVLLTAQGSESALGCTVSFDTKCLNFVGIKLANAAAGASLNVNARQAATGSVGFACMLPLPRHFALGAQTVVELTFSVPANAPLVVTPVVFDDKVVSRALVDTDANTLAVTFVNGYVSIKR